MNLKYIIFYSLQNTNQGIREQRGIEKNREDQINASWLQFLLCSYFLCRFEHFVKLNVCLVFKVCFRIFNIATKRSQAAWYV